jgi:hypothetical protein
MATTDPEVGFGSGADVLEGRPEGVSRPRGVIAVGLAAVTTLLALAAAMHIGSSSPTTPASRPAATRLVSTLVPGEAGRHAVPPAAQLCVDDHHRALVANAKRRGRFVDLEQGRRWCGHEWTGQAQNGKARPDGVRRSGSRRTVLLVDWRI